MKVFLSYQFGDDISALVSLLRDRGIEVFDALTDAHIGSSFQLSIMNSVRESDFLALVFTKPNTNLSFEAGIAVGLDKPIFAIISPHMEVQDYLLDSTYVHAEPEETTKIEFSLNLFIGNLNVQKKRTIKRPMLYGGGEPAPSDYFYNKYIQLQDQGENNYESLFRELFSLYHLNVLQEIPASQDLYADFSIWSDRLSNILSNPILVEIKKQLNANILEKIQQQVYSAFTKSPTSSFLIFYDQLSGLSKKDLPNNPKCFYIQISDLMANLRVTGFNEAITQIRNKIVHNSY